MILVRYNTCLGSNKVQERNWLFKGLFSLVDVSLQIRKEGFYLKLENLYVLLSNVIGQLLNSNALRVLWISIYSVHVLKDLGKNLGAVDKFTCCKLVQIINRPRVHQVQERPSREG